MNDDIFLALRNALIGISCLLGALVVLAIVAAIFTN